MIAVVTGAAGFIGSSLCRRLLDDGHAVTGVDCLTKTDGLEQKIRNLDGLVGREGFHLVYADLAEQPPSAVLHEADVVFHLAGEASVTRSWGPSFAAYARNNVEATQRLLDACVGAGLQRIVYASSSSIYGNALSLPTSESVLPRPISPYGVTKLAAEHLCHAYQSEQGLPITSLRFFTVYGPGQRPDMAFHRLFRAALNGETFTVRGNGSATRDFTYIDDVVDAVVRAGESSWNGALNIGGGQRVSMQEVLAMVQEEVGPISVDYGEAAAGDARDTSADTTLAQEILQWRPEVDLRSGISAMASWASDVFEPELSRS